MDKQKEKEKPEVKKKQKAKEEKKEKPEDKLNDLTNTLKHVQADFENYRKRMERAQEDFRKYACKDVIIKLLPLADNFELALKNAGKEDDFTKGVELIYAQFIQMLEGLGVKSINSLDKKFDPHFHEALLTEKSDKDNIVLEELQKGYIMHGTVLRHAKVKIGKKD